MKRLISLFCAAIIMLGALSACGDSADTPAETEAPTAAPTADSGAVLTDEMRAELRETFDDILTQRLFEGSVYVVYKGEEVYAGGKGYAVKADKIPNSVNVVYEIASNTKQFTAAAILKLCEEGKLSLDDTLKEYFPEYEIGADLTIHSLLSMQSGIPDFLSTYDEDGNEISSTTRYIDGVHDTYTAEQNRAALRKFIFESELLFPQGDRYSYSNSNYYLLGEIIEQVSGMSYHAYIRENFFEPLGMDTAGFIDDYDHPEAVVARGYRGDNSTQWFAYTGIPFGSGDIMASPKDLYKWATALHTGKVLGDEMYQKMTSVYVTDAVTGTNYGYGLMIQKNLGATLCYHSGSIPGFTSALCYIPGQDFFITAISNYSNENTMTVAAKLIEAMTAQMNR